MRSHTAGWGGLGAGKDPGKRRPPGEQAALPAKRLRGWPEDRSHAGSRDQPGQGFGAIMAVGPKWDQGSGHLKAHLPSLLLPLLLSSLWPCLCPGCTLTCDASPFLPSKAVCLLQCHFLQEAFPDTQPHCAVRHQCSDPLLNRCLTPLPSLHGDGGCYWSGHHGPCAHHGT